MRKITKEKLIEKIWDDFCIDNMLNFDEHILEDGWTPFDGLFPDEISELIGGFSVGEIEEEIRNEILKEAEARGYEPVWIPEQIAGNYLIHAGYWVFVKREGKENESQ